MQFRSACSLVETVAYPIALAVDQLPIQKARQFGAVTPHTHAIGRRARLYCSRDAPQAYLNPRGLARGLYVGVLGFYSFNLLPFNARVSYLKYSF